MFYTYKNPIKVVEVERVLKITHLRLLLIYFSQLGGKFIFLYLMSFNTLTIVWNYARGSVWIYYQVDINSNERNFFKFYSLFTSANIFARKGKSKHCFRIWPSSLQLSFILLHAACFNYLYTRIFIIIVHNHTSLLRIA